MRQIASLIRARPQVRIGIRDQSVAFSEIGKGLERRIVTHGSERRQGHVETTAYPSLETHEEQTSADILRVRVEMSLQGCSCIQAEQVGEIGMVHGERTIVEAGRGSSEEFDGNRQHGFGIAWRQAVELHERSVEPPRDAHQEETDRRVVQATRVQRIRGGRSQGCIQRVEERKIGRVPVHRWTEEQVRAGSIEKFKRARTDFDRTPGLAKERGGFLG